MSISRRDFRSRELHWRGNALHLGGRRLAQIEPDAKWPEMWRVRLPDDRLSDMVNISRARDAARALAIKILNSPQGAQEAPPIEQNGGRVP